MGFSSGVLEDCSVAVFFSFLFFVLLCFVNLFFIVCFWGFFFVCGFFMLLSFGFVYLFVFSWEMLMRYSKAFFSGISDFGSCSGYTLLPAAEELCH